LTLTPILAVAPEELKREKDFRVDVQNGIHARACTGGSIAIAESSIHNLARTEALCRSDEKVHIGAHGLKLMAHSAAHLGQDCCLDVIAAKAMCPDVSY
jgi:hypothetical protein